MKMIPRPSSISRRGRSEGCTNKPTTTTADILPSPPTLSRSRSDDFVVDSTSSIHHNDIQRQKKESVDTTASSSVVTKNKRKSKSLRKKLGSLSPTRTSITTSAADPSVISSNSNNKSKRSSSVSKGSGGSSRSHKQSSHGGSGSKLKKTKGFNEDISLALPLAIDRSPILSLEPQSHVKHYNPEGRCKTRKLFPGEFFDVLRIKHLPSGCGGEEEDEEDEDSLDNDEEGEDDPSLGDDDIDASLDEEVINKSNGKSNRRGSTRGGRSSTSKPGKMYVLKRMSQKHSKEKQIVQQATLRLVLEAKYLARLNHKNIVQATGLTHGEEEPLMHGCASRFFIVMERCVETLEERINRWKHEAAATTEEDSNASSGRSNVNGQFNLSSPNNQLKMQYALDLVKALKYLHDRNIVVLNLRPETIGFLQDGKIQIRDLSCCRETDEFEGQGYGPLGFDCDLRVKEVKGDAQSRMAAAKSNFLVLEATVDGLPRPRYVAPEAVVESKYTPAADAYSWAHILFELLTLSKPYAAYKLGQLLTKVWLDGSRPNLSMYKFPHPLEALLQISWRQSSTQRPTMDALVEAIPLLMQLSATVVANPQA